MKEARDVRAAHGWRPADVLGNGSLTFGGEDNFTDLARWLAERERNPREIRSALEESLWLLAWNDETGEGAGRSRVWRDLMREIVA